MLRSWGFLSWWAKAEDYPVTQWSLTTSFQIRIAHAYAGLELPELENVKIPGAPNTKRAMHFYMKAAKQGRLLGESRIYLCMPMQLDWSLKG